MFIYNPEQPSCKMMLWKKMWSPKWQPRNGCGGRLKAKNLITTIQVNLCCLLHVSLLFGTKFTWIVIIKIYAFSQPSQSFLGYYFGFHIFFYNSILGGCTLFLQLGCFGLDFTSFCNFTLESWQITCLMVFDLFIDKV